MGEEIDGSIVLEQTVGGSTCREGDEPFEDLVEEENTADWDAILRDSRYSVDADSVDVSVASSDEGYVVFNDARADEPSSSPLLGNAF